MKNKLSIDRQPNGPEGCLSSLTVRSIDMILNSVKRLSSLITEFNPACLPEVNLESCLTIMVENLHAISHIKQQFPTMLQHSQSFGRMMQEANKRSGKIGFHYFTKESSYYPIPESAISANALPTLPKPKYYLFFILLMMSFKDINNGYKQYNIYRLFIVQWYSRTMR